METIAETGGKVKRLLHVDPMKVENRQMTILTKKYWLDIMALDKIMHERGYTEKKHGSLSDYIKLEYGQEAVDLITELIKKGG